MTTINKFLIQAAIALMTAAGPMAAAEVVPPSNSDRSDTKHLLADASNDVILTLNTPGAYEVNFLALSTTVVYVWGFVGADNTPVFS